MYFSGTDFELQGYDALQLGNEDNSDGYIRECYESKVNDEYIDIASSDGETNEESETESESASEIKASSGRVSLAKESLPPSISETETESGQSTLHQGTEDEPLVIEDNN